MYRKIIKILFLLAIVTLMTGYGCMDNYRPNNYGSTRTYETIKTQCIMCRGQGVRDCGYCQGKGYTYGGYKCYNCGGGVLFVALSATGQDIINNKPAPACLISNLSFSLPKVQYKPGQGVTGYDTPEYEQVLTQRQGKV